MRGWISVFILLGVLSASSELIEFPKFAEPIINVTVAVGREAIFVCIVDDLQSYKVAWLRVDTQTILTIHNHVITKNHRIGVSHSDHRTWYLHIKEVKESDRGWYMCQINTDPMKSQVGYMEVVVPPDVLDYPTSSDTIVREGSNATFRCAASGTPAPNITWKRESGNPIILENGIEVSNVDGPVLNLTNVNRADMGAYLCIASNGVPPSVSKRIMLIVNFPPSIHTQHQLIGAYEGQHLTLECNTEAQPKSINYWTRDKGDIIVQGAKFEPVLYNNAYKTNMKLTIKSISASDFGAYKCVARNSLGETDQIIKVYPVSGKRRVESDSKMKYKQKKLQMKSSFIGETNSTNPMEHKDGDESEQYEDYEQSSSISSSLKFYANISFLTLFIALVVVLHN